MNLRGCLILPGLLCLPLAALADIHYVSLTGGNIPPYTNWANAATNIQDAVNAAAPGETVLVTNGTYLLAAQIVATNAIALESLNGPSATVLNAGYSNRCVYLDWGSVLDGFTVTRGQASLGAGIFCDHASVARNCTIIGNVCGPNSGWPAGGTFYGGGVYCDHGSAVEDCYVAANSGSGGYGAYNPVTQDYGHDGGDGYGGGLYLDHGSRVINSMIVSNAANGGSGSYGHGGMGGSGGDGHGGGVFCDNGSAVLNCIVAVNSSSGGGGWNTYRGLNGYGGGIYCNASTVEDCQVIENIAAPGWCNASYGGSGWGYGMGIYAISSSVTRCTITGQGWDGNYVTGAGIYMTWSRMIDCLVTGNYCSAYAVGCHASTIENSTIAYNRSSSGYQGGGVVVDAGSAIINSIIYFNEISYEGNYAAFATDLFTYCCTTPDPGGVGNITNDPQFVDAAGGDYHLLSDSPCIDAGTNLLSDGVTNDLDGTPRPLDGNNDGAAEFDIGAYEYSSNLLTLTVNGAPAPHGFPDPLGYGTHWLLSGMSVTDAVASPVLESIGSRYVCTGWTGSGDVPASGPTNSVSFTLTTNSTLTWNWQAEYQLTLVASGGSITGATAGFKTQGSVIELYPLPPAGYGFDHWETNGVPVGSGVPLTVTMDMPQTITAVFSADLVITGSPSYHSSPSPLDYGTYSVPVGTVVTNEVASPADVTTDTEYLCTGWSGSGSVPVSGSSNSVTFTSTTNSTLTWNWQTAYQLTLQANHGSITGATAGFEAEASFFNLFPTAAVGYFFNGWRINGANSGYIIPLALTMNGPKTVTALFGKRLASRNDFNNDLSADLAVFDPATGRWYIRSVTNGTVIAWNVSWGFKGCTSLQGDYDGDGVNDLAVYDNASAKWYIRSLVKTNAIILWGHTWGFPGCIPVSGDFNGDSISDLAVYYPPTAVWYVQGMTNGAALVWNKQWGYANCVPVPADYDGDRKTDLAVYDVTKGDWWILPANGGAVIHRQWGFKGCVPVPGDYDGDGKTDLTVWDTATGTWYIYFMGTGKTRTINWGFKGCIPLSADYDGDGADDLAVYNPANALWYILSVRTGVPIAMGMSWGYPGTVPVGGHQ